MWLELVLPDICTFIMFQRVEWIIDVLHHAQRGQKKRCWCHQRPRWSTSHPSKGAVLDVCLRMGIETTNQHLKIMNPLSSQPLQLLGWSLTYLIIAALVHLTRFTSNLSWFLICSHRLCGTEKSGHVTWQMWQMGCLSVGSQCMKLHVWYSAFNKPFVWTVWYEHWQYCLYCGA